MKEKQKIYLILREMEQNREEIIGAFSSQECAKYVESMFPFLNLKIREMEVFD